LVRFYTNIKDKKKVLDFTFDAAIVICRFFLPGESENFITGLLFSDFISIFASD
jgi:hypothetical protein